MHKAHKLLLALLTVAAVPFTSSASAQTLEITHEGGDHCEPVFTDGTDVNSAGETFLSGCLFHVNSNGNVELRKHVFGIESHITNCTNEFAGRVNEDIVGYIFEQVLAGAGCSRQACRTGTEGIPWGMGGNEFGASAESIYTTFCVEPVGGGTDELCELTLPLESSSNQHRFEFGNFGFEYSSHGISGFRCELVGHWNSETGGSHDGQAEQELVVTHTF